MDSSFSIRDLSIAPRLVLAPMSGVTCSPFRRLIKELNPGAVGLVITEFISVEGLTRGSARSVQMMAFHPSERPFGIQIFGYDPERMRDAAVMAEEAGADLVDINCGCPAPKVVQKGGGCELMRQPDHLKTLFATVRKAVRVPLTMKMRSGWDEDSTNCVEIARMAEGEGLEAVTVHGRTRSQLYRGEANWEWVHRVAEAVKIPVCGSGDIVDAPSFAARVTGRIAGGYVGRAVLENPLVFSDIVRGAHQPTLRRDRRLPASEVFRILRRYGELLEESFAPPHITGRLKQLATQLCRHLPLREPLLRATSYAQQKEILASAVEVCNSSPGLSP